MDRYKEIKSKLSKDEIIKCNAIIHGASVAAGVVGAGLAQIPLSDNALITPIQIFMITSLGAVFHHKIIKSAAKGLLLTFATAFIGRGISELVVGWIPGLGNVINASTAATITEGVGWLAVKYFKELPEISTKVTTQNKKPRGPQNMSEGYARASKEYEDKLKKQAEEFLNQKINLEKNFETYEKLLDKYVQVIKDLQGEKDRTKEENRILLEILGTYMSLKDLNKLLNHHSEDDHSEK